MQNVPRLCNALQPGCDVDAVAKDIVVVDDDVTDMDADTEFNSDILRDVGVLRGHGTLDFGRAAGGIDSACELHKQAITGSLDDAPPMGSYGGVNNSFSNRLQPGQGAFPSAPMRRLYPATSAASTAASRRSTRSPIKGASNGRPTHQSTAGRLRARANVRFGSSADIPRCEAHVRFAPNSGHRRAGAPCPLSAKPGSERVTKNTLTNGHCQAAEHVRLVPLAEAMLMAEFVCICRRSPPLVRGWKLVQPSQLYSEWPLVECGIYSSCNTRRPHRNSSAGDCNPIHYCLPLS